ncbi:MAG TPA: hypothetical protein VLV86_12265 [Vicinamibacterales bacterium]|nr:hypothetical protein [Thermoanaerobaculia bacterium]HUK34684.1 hypothetical protein [Vicinamibacterales bacterium]
MLVYRVDVPREDRRGATDSNCVHIQAIDSLDALGYRGCGREEHSGENAPLAPPTLELELADNRAEDRT